MPQSLDGAKECRLKVDRIKYWLSVGAQPSDRVAYLLWRSGLMPAPPIHYSPTAWIKKSERPGAKKKFHTLSDVHVNSGSGYSAISNSNSIKSPSLMQFSGFFSRGSMFSQVLQ